MKAYPFPIKIILIAALTLISLANSSLADQYDDLMKYLYPEKGETKTISMDFKNAQLSDVLKIFSQQSGLNFIAASDVSNKLINLYLDKVPVEEALERILSAHSLTYELDATSNIFVVKQVQQPAVNLMTRIYKLRNSTVSSSKLKSTLSENSEEEGGGSAATGTTSGIIDVLKSILTTNGKAIEDTRTNSIAVTDIPSQFPIIEQTIARLDQKAPQVLIEVEMLDISKETADLLGAKFGESPVSFRGGEKDTLYPFNTDNALEGTSADFSFDEARYRVSTLSFQGLTFLLQFLHTQSDVKSLARPRILTLDNETATIEISTNEAIGIGQTTSSSEGTATSSVEAERVETGVFLKVTPQINIDSGEITMALEPRVVEARTGGTFDGTTFKDPEVRGTKSLLRIKDGDTIMIGGLLRTDDTDIRTKVPMLGNLPVVGSAFRHKDKSESQRELIIFLSPHILKDDMTVSNPSAFDRPNEIVREQTIPAKRLEEINREVAQMDYQKN